jgi:hypothetical protein
VLSGEESPAHVFVRKGPHGYYLECNGKRKNLDMSEEAISSSLDLTTAIQILEDDSGSQSKNILRVLTPEMSVRKSQYGNYVYYCTAGMTKPRFVNIKKFPEDPLTCDAQVLIDWVTTAAEKPAGKPRFFRGGGGRSGRGRGRGRVGRGTS